MSLGNAKGPIRKRKQHVHTCSRETITDRERLLTEIDLKPRRSGELGRPTQRHHLAITASVAPLQAPSHTGDAASWPAMSDQTRGLKLQCHWKHHKASSPPLQIIQSFMPDEFHLPFSCKQERDGGVSVAFLRNAV